MTNAEKFKEDFGHEPNTNCPFDVYCPQCKWNNDRTDCISKFWHSEYQGEPTIPLSVIEKIHDAIDNADCDARLEDENGSYTEEVFTREHIHEIIDKAVREVEK